MSKKEVDPGDLREVEKHVKALLAGNEEAVGEIMTFGRDAAGIIARIAEEKKSEQLKELSKRLIAVPPQVPTNMFELRAAAVKELISKAQDKSPNATDVRDFSIASPMVVLFDPQKISDAIAKSGKPRRDAERVGKGDIVFFGAEMAPIKVTLTTAAVPEGQEVVSNRLKVESGIIFVGPPEASDGPRLGEVRMDPFRTNLHLHLSKGRFVRLKPGSWRASAYQRPGGEVRVHLSVDPDPAAAAVLADLSSLAMLPFAAMDERKPAD
jgi:hypothetical protein